MSHKDWLHSRWKSNCQTKRRRPRSRCRCCCCSAHQAGHPPPRAGRRGSGCQTTPRHTHTPRRAAAAKHYDSDAMPLRPARAQLLFNGAIAGHTFHVSGAASSTPRDGNFEDEPSSFSHDPVQAESRHAVPRKSIRGHVRRTSRLADPRSSIAAALWKILLLVDGHSSAMLLLSGGAAVIVAVVTDASRVWYGALPRVSQSGA